jgi:hypothetical protein
VFGLKAEAYEAAGQALHAGEAGGEAEEDRRVQGAFGVEGAVHDVVREGLDALGAENGFDAVVLHPLQMMIGEGVGEERLGQDVGCGDRVLEGYVDADAADGRHGVGGIADAEEAGGPPFFKMVDLDGEELDLVPGIEMGGTSAEEGGELLDAGAEGFEAALLDDVEVVFGDDVAGLKVVAAVDEDERAAVVDVAESVLGVGGLAGNLEPEDVDGDPLLDDFEVGGFARHGVAAVATDGEVGVDFCGTVGCVGADADDMAGMSVGVGAKEADCFPTQAEVEGGEGGCFGAEEVEEVPLWHEDDVFCDGGEMSEVGDLKPTASNDGGEAGDVGVRECEKAIEQAELVKELQRGGVDGVAAEVAVEVSVFFEDGDGDAGAGEKEAEHDSGWASADDAAGGVMGMHLTSGLASSYTGSLDACGSIEVRRRGA